MGKPSGFLDYERLNNHKTPVKQRIKNYDEFHSVICDKERKEQGARCMNCGVPFCTSPIELSGMVTGCPLNNLIPEFNDEIFAGNYSHGLTRLLKTNCFPEFTGRVCPALCEKACINGLDGTAVTIKDNEMFLIEEGFKNGNMMPRVPKFRSDKSIAVIGSGPSGLAVAQKLNQRGHNVTVFERDDKFGGLLMYGIPNMKLDKAVVQRRIDLMRAEGINFENNMDFGNNLSLKELEKNFDAIVLCCGAKKARDLELPHRNSNGIYFAVDYLSSTTKSLIDENLKNGTYICAKDKNVIILGGGDTGNDCVGTAIRHGAKSVKQIEMMPKLPSTRQDSNPWPEWPKVSLTDYGQEEAIEVFGDDPRVYETTIKEIIQKDGTLVGVVTVKLEFKDGKLSQIPKSEKTLSADLLLIAAGFTGYEDYIAKDVKIPTKTDLSFKTNRNKVFACGDIKRGQSLVVWAISDGIKCAKEVDDFLCENI